MKRTAQAIAAALLTLSALAATPAITPAAPATAVAPYYDANGPEGTIYRLYRAYFLREPDRAGFDYWFGVYRQGYALDKISNDFARSAEFQQRYGNVDNRRFLELVYQNVLGRNPDQGGYDYWLDQMNRGMLRGFVMIYFSDSAEFRDKTRDGTPPGYQRIQTYFAGAGDREFAVAVRQPSFARIDPGIYRPRPLSLQPTFMSVWTLDYNRNKEELLTVGSRAGEHIIYEWPITAGMLVDADGEWEIEIVPMASATAVNLASPFEGRGDAVRAVSPGGGHVRFTHDGDGNFAVWALDRDLNRIGLVANEIDDATDLGTIPAHTVYLDITAGGAWSFRPA